MSSGVAFGSPVSSGNTNASLLAKNGDDTAAGKITLANTDVASGAQVDSIQKDINGQNSFTGRTPNGAYNSKPTWTNNDVGSSTDDLKTRADDLTAEFNNSTGHGHSGSAGDGGPILSSSIASVELRGTLFQGTNLTGVTGSSFDVSSTLVGQTPSTAPAIRGVVVNNPYNRVALRSLNDVELVDAGGNEVYGRLTYAASVWTLSFYSEIVSVETVYSFGSSTTIKWYPQILINPIADIGFNYSPQLVTPSANTTADVVYATSSVAGKILLASSAPADPGSSASTGSVAKASLENHSHRGVLSVQPLSGSPIYGSVNLKPGAGITLSQAGQDITINASGSGSSHPVRAVSSTDTATNADYQIHATGTYTQTLYVPADGDIIQVKNAGTGEVTLIVTGGALIDGETSQVLFATDSANLYGYGGNWFAN